MNQTLSLSLWRTFSRGRREQHTWREFIDTFVANPEVARYKESIAGFSLGKFTDNRRTLTRVEHVHALTLDFDGGDTTIKQAPGLLGCRGVAYTTFSHTEAWPKLRIIYLLSRPVDADEYERIWMQVAEKIMQAGHALDESTRDASRFWYLPSHPPGAPYSWRELEGPPLDVEGALRAAPTLARPFQGAAPGRQRGASKARGYPAPGKGRASDDDSAEDSFFGRAFAVAGLTHEIVLDNGALVVTCPWSGDHTSGYDGDTSTVVFPPTSDAQWGLFHCSHAHCARRSAFDVLDTLPAAALEEARRDHGGGLVRTVIRAGFVQQLDAVAEVAALARFVLRCYPHGGGAPLIWTVKINSRAHIEGLDSLPLPALRRRKADLALRGREIVWGRLVPA